MGKNFDGLLSEIADVLDDAHALQVEHHFPVEYWDRVAYVSSLALAEKQIVMRWVVHVRPMFQLYPSYRKIFRCGEEEGNEHLSCVLENSSFAYMTALICCVLCGHDLPASEATRPTFNSFTGVVVSGMEFIDHIGICPSCRHDLAQP